MDLRLSVVRALVAAAVFLPASCAPRRPAVPEDCHVRYVRWDGVSPGAGFSLTSLHVVEMDFGGGRKRVLRKTARAPAPMLPHQLDAIAKMADATPWRDLPADEAARLARLVDSWLATRPPARYNDFRPLGREDGCLEQLTVVRGATTVTTAINPRGWASPSDPLAPPKEWRALIDALCGPTRKAGQLMPAQ